MVTVSPPNPESRQIASVLADLEMRMRRIEAGLRTRQLGNSSLDGTGIAMFDADGNDRGVIGFQTDGTTTITSKNPLPPPIPISPQVTPSIATLIVSHRGETEDGSSNPADFSHLNVYTADALDPDVRTFRGTINPVPGEFVVSGLDYTSYLVDVTSVNYGGKESIPSGSVEATPQQVVGADIIEGAIDELVLADGAVTEAKIAADAVTTTKIADDSISSPKIIAGAVQASEIAASSISASHIVSRSITADRLVALTLTANEIAANAITAGKIQAGAVTATKLEADLVVASRIIAGSPTGARVEMHPIGLQAFNSAGSRTMFAEASTGNFSAVGSLSTGFTGQRIVMNPNGTQPDQIVFYPASGSRVAAIDSFTSGTGGAGIAMYGADDSGAVTRGMVIAREDVASLSYCNPSNILATIKSDIFASANATRNRAKVVDIMTDVDQGSDAHIGFMETNGITINNNSLLFFTNSHANGGEPYFSAPYRDVGLSFAPSYTGWSSSINVLNYAHTAWRDIYCLSLIYASGLVSSSSRELKSNIEPTQDLDPRQAVRNARAKYFQVDMLAEEASYDPDGNLLSEAKEAPIQMGLIAEELPSEVTTMVAAPQPGNREQFPGIDRDSLVTLLWQGQGDIQNRLDTLERNPLHIAEVQAPPPAPTTGATLYAYAGSLYVIHSTGKILKIG